MMNSRSPGKPFRRTCAVVAGLCHALALWSAAAALAAAPEDTPARALLDEAEALYTGTSGKVDPERAVALVRQAADAGHPLARLRLATFLHLGSAGLAKDPAGAAALARPVVDEVLRRAEQGDALAQYLAGNVFLLGLGRPADLAAAASWYRRAAAAGQPWALHNLGWMHASGTGAERDPAAATRWYLRAAEAGNVNSMVDVAGAYVEGRGVDQDLASARRWIERAAATGQARAMGYLGALLVDGGLGAAAPEEAVPWLRRAADLGDAAAQTELGYCLAQGLGVERDLGAAARWFRRAGDTGYARAMNFYGWALVHGRGVAADPATGAEWLAAAVMSGDPWAPANLLRSFADEHLDPARFKAVVGRLEQAAAANPHAAGFLAEMYLSGTGARPDYELAARFARSAAEGGDSGGMRVLGELYRHGLGGLPEDPSKSVEWWRRAAALGETYSMYFLAFPYLEGKGVDRDIPKGLEWLERAGHAGNPWAMKYLGDLYETGWSVIRPDPDKVLYWRKKAAASGDEAAQGWLKFRELTGEE